MGVNSLPKTVTQQRRDCDYPGPSTPESSTLTTRLAIAVETAHAQFQYVSAESVFAVTSLLSGLRTMGTIRKCHKWTDRRTTAT